MDKEQNIDEILRQLKRFSFDAKMNICSQHSQDILKGIFEGNNVAEMGNGIYPWELESFVMMSIKATPEYDNRDFEGKNIKYFIAMINGIKNTISSKHMHYEGRKEFADFLMTSSALQQFNYQESIQYKLFRYTYFFDYKSSKIDMGQLFIKKFGCPYERFSIFAMIMMIIYIGFDKFIISHTYFS